MTRIRPRLHSTDTHKDSCEHAVTRALVYCQFCGTRQAALASRWCAACASPFPDGRVAESIRAARGGPSDRHGPLSRGIGLCVHARWPLVEPVAAVLVRPTADGIEFIAPEAFAAGQLLRLDAPGFRALGRVVARRPAARGRHLTGVGCESLWVDPVARTDAEDRRRA